MDLFVLLSGNSKGASWSISLAFGIVRVGETWQ